MEILEFPEANLAKSRSQQKPAISLVIPTPVRQPRPMAGGDSPPGTPADSSTVRELLRKFDGGLSGEVFGSDRLLKLSVLGKGSTSTVWEAVDVDTLQVVAMKEMVVCDSKQTAVLEHELRVLHSQLQPLPGCGGNFGGCAWGCDCGGDCGSGGVRGGAPSELGQSVGNCSRSGSNSGRGGGGQEEEGEGGQGEGEEMLLRQQEGEQRPQQQSQEEKEQFCPYMPRYFGSFLSENEVDDNTRVCIVEEHVPGGDLGRWIDEGALHATTAAAAKVGATGETNGDTGGAGPAATGRAIDKRERKTWRSLTSSSKSVATSPGFSNASSEDAVSPLPPPPEEWLARVCRDTLEALRHLHSRRCIHRDVKPANILLDNVFGGAKLADFGSTVREKEDAAAHRMHGTIRFMSPERLYAKQCSPSSDLWSAGLTVAAAALGENPVPHCANEFDALVHAEAAFSSVKAHPGAALLSDALMDFLKDVLVAQPDERPTVEQMLRHPFVLRAEKDVPCGARRCGDLTGGEAVLGNGNRRGIENDVRCGCLNSGSEKDGGGGGGGGGGRTEGEYTAYCSNLARRDSFEWLRNKRSGATAASPKDVVRRIITARRARRNRRGKGGVLQHNGLEGSGGGGGGRCDGTGSRAGRGTVSLQQVPSPLRALDITHLASVLHMSAPELHSLFSCVNAELDNDLAYASESSWDTWSASSSVSNSLSPLRTRTTAVGGSSSSSRGGGCGFSPATGTFAAAVGKKLLLSSGVVGPTTVATTASPSEATTRKSSSRLSPKASATTETPEAKLLARPPARTATRRLTGWHHRGQDDRNRNNKSTRSGSNGGGHGSHLRSAFCGGGGTSPGTSSSGKTSAAGGVVGRLWSRVHLGRFKSSGRSGGVDNKRGGLRSISTADPPRGGGEPGGGRGQRDRRDLLYLVDTKESSFNARTRPPSGLDDCNMDLPGCSDVDTVAAAAAATALVPPDVARRTGLLPGAANRSGCGSRGSSEYNFFGSDDSEPGPGRAEASPGVAPGWGTVDVFRGDGDSLGAAAPEL